MLKKLLIFSWIVGAIFLLLYSFTQIDLSLTVSHYPVIQILQKKFQYIGWFDRPLSSSIYISILIYLFLIYLITIFLIFRKKISLRTVIILISSISALLIFSYNAFSYDLFNYIFDAKIITFYHKNPYLFKALDFPNDPMLTFMRSVHRVYPYGPSWIIVTAALSFIGFNFFVITFALFKLLSVISYLICCYFIYKISSFNGGKNTLISLGLFALNPLVIIESLVSAHNETFMMALALWSIYFMLVNKKLLSLMMIAISIGVKYTTIFLMPLTLLSLYSKKLDYNKINNYSLILMTFALIATSLASGQNKNPEFQPWYLLSVAPFAALSKNISVMIIFISITFLSLFMYLPYISQGSWPENIVLQKNILLMVGFVIGSFIILGFKLLKKSKYVKKI